MNVAFFVLVGLIWGSVWLPIKLAVSVFPPFTTAATRILIASLLALGFVWLQKIPLPDRRTIARCMIIGLLSMGVPWLLLFWGQQFIYPALSSILNSTVPLFTTIFAWLIFNDREEVSWRKALGVLCGFCGVLVIFFPELNELHRGSNHPVHVLLGMLALIGMTMSYGLSIMLLKAWTAHVNPNMNLCLQGVSSIVLVGGAALLFERSEYHDLWARDGVGVAILSVLFLAIFGSFLALNMFLRLVARIGGVRAGSVTYVVPLVAILIDWFYFGVWPTPAQWLGATLILAGLVVLNRRNLGRGLGGKNSHDSVNSIASIAANTTIHAEKVA
jgi:drug/metabolite transporter (DMT)-like permease